MRAVLPFDFPQTELYLQHWVANKTPLDFIVRPTDLRFDHRTNQTPMSSQERINNYLRDHRHAAIHTPTVVLQPVAMRFQHGLPNLAVFWSFPGHGTPEEWRAFDKAYE